MINFVVLRYAQPVLDIDVSRTVKVKVKVVRQQAEVAQGVQGRLRPRIFFTFGTTRVVGRQPYAPATFTPGEIPGTHFQRLSRPQGTWFCREPRKKSPVTLPGIDPGTVWLVSRGQYVLKIGCLSQVLRVNSRTESSAVCGANRLYISFTKLL